MTAKHLFETLAEDDGLLSDIGLLGNELAGSIENSNMAENFWTLNSNDDCH